MKKVYFFCSLTWLVFLFMGCAKSNKTIIRQQHFEEGVQSPTTVEELKNAIAKYQNRVADIQLAQAQIGIWYKILGTRYLDNKMYGEALKTFQKAIEYFPTNQNLYYYVGLCAGYMAHSALDYDATASDTKKYNYLKLSESAYLEALRIEPRYARALYGLSILYVFELDENEKAVPLLEKLLTIETRNVDAMFVLARAYYSTYEFDKAAAVYDKIIQTTKSDERKKEAQANKKIVLDAAYAK
ncbi:tetratricopeptide repeat protein [Treponema parvum]|uniref:Tetratricopeptide repeat protein n=1 Tax=Treponema parvum TaxID=138851 RepID=A0A975F322_9SPIR|nr:tetratricopeptide repeat protein [Treponema parvum]QTQ13730.1 tetratricopeptide repeat protein [Treponema parvum]